MNILDTLRHNKALVILMAMVGILVAIGVTLFQPFEYRSTFSVLVIEKGNTQDAFTAAKSAERLSLSLGQIIYTTSFYDKVMQSEFIPANVTFPSDDQQRRDEWKRRIETRVMPDIGQMKISVYDRDAASATALANALAMVLSEQGTEYLGGSDGVTLKVVDYPLTSKRPARPNIPMNLAAGLLLGSGAAVGYLTARSVRRQQEPKRIPEIPYTPIEVERVAKPEVRAPRQNADLNVERVPVTVAQPNQYMFQNQYSQVASQPQSEVTADQIPDESVVIHTPHDRMPDNKSNEAGMENPKKEWTALPEEEFRNFE
jgi:capsular polysaccharide biosynthesis protein